MNTPLYIPSRTGILLAICLSLPILTFAQKLDLKEVSTASEGDHTVFNLEFEDQEKEIETSLTSVFSGYDSLSVDAYEVVTLDGGKSLKISSYLYNPQTNQKLRWLVKGEYTERAKQLAMGRERLLSGKFIQLGAFDNFQNANTFFRRISEFDVEIILVNDQYKLVTPYSLEDYRKARTIYKDAWPVVYKQGSLATSGY